MPGDRAHDWLMQRVLRRDRTRAAARGDRPGVSVLSQLFATASVGLALVVLAAIGGGAGRPMPPWNVPQEVVTDVTAPPTVVTVLALSPQGMLLALVGAALGAAGIALRRSRREVPWLCAVGLVACVLCMIWALVYDLIVFLIHSPWSWAD
jgi:hypothetical protein